jgi:ankyrin repeat protein
MHFRQPRDGKLSQMVDEPDDQLIAFATRLFGLARAGETGQLSAYLDAGVDANLANQKGDTLIMLAAYHGHADTVRALLERSADPDRANDRGQTPLAGAVFKGEDEVIRALAAAGADPQAGTPSAVATARMFERTDLLELLGAAGNDPAESS